MPEAADDQERRQGSSPCSSGGGDARPAEADASAPAASLAGERGEASAIEAGGDNTGEARPIEELTLLELIQGLWRAPRPTWKRLRIAMAAEAVDDIQHAAPPAVIPIPLTPPADAGGRASTAIRSLPLALRQSDNIKLLLYASAIVCALVGSVIARGTEQVTRADGYSLNVGAPFLWLGFLLWLAAEIAGRRRQLSRYWRRLDRDSRLRWAARALPLLIASGALIGFMASLSAPGENAADQALASLGAFVVASALWIAIDIAWWRVQRHMTAPYASERRILPRSPAGKPIREQISRRRILIIALATTSSIGVWFNTAGNRIEPPIILLWLTSAALWGFAFAPLRWNLFDWASGKVDAIRRIRWRAHRPAIIALGLVLLLGAAFRFHQLDAYPPQMYSDLVEKIQDAYKIHHQDDYRVFFSNIGGREPLHFYLLSILASQPGLEFDHFSLKLMSALESFVTLPLFFWLGVEVMGRRRRRLGLAVGILLAGLAAVSFWHVMIGRQGMRISLAPLFSALFAICLARALRHNRRADYVCAGLALGFGLMGYQAVRMLPLAAVAGVAIAIVLARKPWQARLTYLLNLAALAFVALMVFLPLLHYWVEEPESYMRRANTRVFGDAPKTETERAQFLAEAIPVLLDNIKKTALMFHHYGASTWVSGLGDEPAMDPASAAFVLLGAAAWLALIARRRDPVYAFAPAYLIATLLPTTLALSFPNEVPSFIRASGAIPPSYLFAALPLALFCRQLRQSIAGRSGIVFTSLFSAAVLLAANHYNTSLYFGAFTDNYARTAHPQAQAGKILRGFAESDGAYGNAFVLTSPHWWDYRAVGIEAGQMFWDSGGEVETTPAMLERGLWREPPFQLAPERDLLFFYSWQNSDAASMLSQWFPNGRQTRIEVQPAHKSFYVFRAPALGAAGLARFLEESR